MESGLTAAIQWLQRAFQPFLVLRWTGNLLHHLLILQKSTQVLIIDVNNIQNFCGMAEDVFWTFFCLFNLSAIIFNICSFISIESNYVTVFLFIIYIYLYTHM